MKRVSESELAAFRGMDVEGLLPRLAEYAKLDPSFEPIKERASARWHVTAAGREFELLTLGPKFFDTRQRCGGGGAIDLVMHLYRLDFKRAVERLRAAL